MSDQTGEVVEASPAVRHLPAKDDFPAMRVDHYTLRIGGQSYPITAYRPLTDAAANVGDSLTGEFQGADKWDKDRNKFRVKQQATAGANVAPAAPPPVSGGTPIGGIFPTIPEQPAHPPPTAQPVPAPASENGSRLEQLLAYVGATIYLEANDVDSEGFNLAAVYNTAAELRYRAGNPDPTEPDTRDLPPSP